ncbi:hypothetical protein J2S43_002048 [Catenuloplanes nepalensis]|uniref:Uncharacterized protein n=1 Tax=Catenuloplanes nepalensis TaxID=587533 RepID=A0ABT9MR78_9ACTN|nr:hypothetical protein [Catenuloplanes nepalensis]MDP9793536.1 hypothetical protein [Catenuloplanes nepalensis]
METRRRFVERATSGPGYATIVAATALLVGVAGALLEAWNPW